VLYPPELHALGVEGRFRLQTTGYRLQNGSPGGIPALDAELERLAPLRRLVGHYRGPHSVTHGGLRRLRDPFPSDARAACSEGFRRKTTRSADPVEGPNFRKALG
jgi:hypothetical protein